ncbi:P-loop NTPase fold protein [Actinokineospora soli]|uniref:P-loop NTPase fold protein n=1 Tax=Actinokineospora soli TaxID=1048753 RepID=A0ABW2TIZ1_9PSEU
MEALRRVVLFDRPDATAAVIRQVWRDRIDVGPRLSGGVARDLVRATEAIPLHRDRLGVAPYVSMLAEAITAENTETPLSVGVFGNWGSGKSFFMGMLRGRVAELAGTPDHCGRVEQIGFNAWHYADTDLWASLGDVIFRALAGPDPDPSAKQAAVRESLADASRRRAELAEVTARAEREVARLTASVDEARGKHVAGARAVLAALRESDKLADHTARMWAGLGVDDESEQAKLLSDELRGHREDAAALRRTARTRNGRIALVVAGVVLALALVLALVLPAVAASVGVLAVLVGGGARRRSSGRARASACSARWARTCAPGWTSPPRWPRRWRSCARPRRTGSSRRRGWTRWSPRSASWAGGCPTSTRRGGRGRSSPTGPRATPTPATWARCRSCARTSSAWSPCSRTGARPTTPRPSTGSCCTSTTSTAAGRARWCRCWRPPTCCWRSTCSSW